MRPYLAVVDARFRMLLQYRAAAIAGVWTQIVFGLVLIMIYEAFYRSSTATVQPMSFAHLASYVWLCQAFLAMLPWNADPELKAMVRSGAVAYELCRPVDLYALWYARAIAHRTAPTLLRCVPMAVFAMFVLPAFGQGDLALEPPEPAAGLAFATSLLTTIVLACAMATLINITLLWTLAGEGIVMMASTVVAFFSGLLVPLPLFPDWAQTLLAWLPFAGLADQPFRIYTGVIPLEQIPLVLGRQLGWALVLVMFGRWLLSRGLRRIVVQGG
jgi:ABC-2 type transport system permease protein